MKILIVQIWHSLLGKQTSLDPVWTVSRSNEQKRKSSSTSVAQVVGCWQQLQCSLSWWPRQKRKRRRAIARDWRNGDLATRRKMRTTGIHTFQTLRSRSIPLWSGTNSSFEDSKCKAWMEKPKDGPIWRQIVRKNHPTSRLSCWSFRLSKDHRRWRRRKSKLDRVSVNRNASVAKREKENVLAKLFQ